MSTHNVEALLAECRSGDPARQVAAVRELAEMGAYESAPAVVELLSSPDTMVRYVAAGALARLGEKEPDLAGAALVGLLTDAEEIVRAEAVDSLGLLEYAPAVERVTALLSNDPAPLVRASAAETLGEIGDAGTVAALERALADADDAVRAFAANSIGLLATPDALPRLRSYVEREQAATVKAELQGALYRLGDAEAFDSLLESLDAADEDLATNILNLLHDLAERRTPQGFSTKAARLRSTLSAVATRHPILSADAERVSNALPAPPSEMTKRPDAGRDSS